MAKLGEKLTFEQAMEIAISEARKAAGFTSPNPLVGSVVLDSNDQFLASGFHEKYGSAHAEVNAIQKVPIEKLEGAKVIVTLEPCAHEGKTPSCAKSLAQLPISTVVYGVVDPNPLVSGKGLSILKNAGKATHHLKEFEEKCKELAEVFFVNQNLKRPFVALKVASSLDGFIGLKNGESQWITGELARQQGHYLRGIYDAICVGANTFITDNPKLNTRHPQFPKKSNKVIIIDERGNLIPQILESEMVKHHDLSNVYVVLPKSKLQDITAKIQCIPYEDKNGLPVMEVLEAIYKLGICSVLIEGGAKTYTKFLKAKLVDRLHCFIAPSLIGHQEGLSWTKELKIHSLKDQITFQRPEVEILGRDIYISTRLES